MEDGSVERAFRLGDYVTDIDNEPGDIEFKLAQNSNKRIKVTLDDDGWISVTPNPDQSGAATVEVEADDGTDESSATFKVVVSPVNDAPVVELKSHIGGGTVLERVEFVGTAADVEGTLERVEVIKYRADKP